MKRYLVKVREICYTTRMVEATDENDAWEKFDEGVVVEVKHSAPSEYTDSNTIKELTTDQKSI